MKQIRPFLAALILLIGANVHAQTITTGSIIGSSFCAGTNVNVPYTVSATFNSGNVFRAQLSDASGVFGSSPTVIGSLTSRTNGTIAATIPSTTPAGTNYRVRVVSTNPIRTGSESSSILTIKSSGTCNVAGALIDDLLDVAITSPSNGQILSYNGSNWVNSSASSAAGGTVTNVSVVSANGFAGSVANPTTTPALTLSTTVTGLLKGNGTSLSAAVSGTDYAAASHTHAITDVTLLNDSLRKKSDTSHTHTISKITGLQTAMDGRWNLNGNNLNDRTTNFIGSTNNQPLVFKTNNTISGIIDPELRNISIGYSSLPLNSTGSSNTSVGTLSLPNNTTGSVNTAFGYSALQANTSGNNNVGIGYQSLVSNQSGDNNIAISSRDALFKNISGGMNIAIGNSALYNTLSSSNMGIGNFAGDNNINGSFITTIGYDADVQSTNLNNATAIGANALVNCSNCMILGSVAGINNATENTRVGIGTIAPDQSAAIEVKSTEKGLLIPRMTKVQRESILSPATGLLVYQIDYSKGIWQYDGSEWTTSTTQNWSVAGNSGLNTSTNFIGTTDAVPLNFKVNNIGSGIITSASSVINSTGANTAFGYSSFLSNSTGYNNTANGAFSLASNTTGTVNTAIGKASLYSNTNGSENVAVGVNALYANTGGYANVAVGLLSSSNNTNGSYNTAVGTNSLEANISGRDNTAVGFFALKNNTASYNVAVGSNAMYSNTTGDGNVAVGALSLYFNTTGHTNTSLGASSLFKNLSGSENTAVGAESLTNNTTGSSNTAIGISALHENTIGGYNTAVGVNSLLLNTTGGGNTAIGLDALKGNTTGKENSALGLYSMRLNTTGDGNSSFGFQSLYNNTLGYWNSSFGHDALSSNTEGFDNVGIGKNAMLLNATGYQNTGVGHGALAENTTGSLNTALGSDADVITGNLTNATAIGANAIVNNSNQVQLGSSGTTVSGGTYLTTSDGRFKKNLKEDAPGLAFIMKLKPVTYNLQYTKYSDFLKEKNADKAHLQLRESKREMGLVAQEVEKACKDLGIEVSNLVHVPENEKDNYSLAYGNLVVPLIKAIQEQQQEIDELKKLVGQQPNANNSSSVTVNNTGASATLENTLTAPLLGQNIPNPFTKTTVIPFRIPGNCTDATIVISNLATGQVVKAIPVSCKETQLSIDASQLASGSYSYSLYIDGKSVLTKKMTLSR